MRPRTSKRHVTVALYELRVRRGNKKTSPSEIHEFLMESFMAGKLDLDETNLLLSQCRDRGLVVAVPEDDEDHADDKAALERGPT